MTRTTGRGRPWRHSGMRWRQESGRAHRWVGAAASLVLLVLAGSGLLLAHPDWIGASPEETSSLAADPGDPQLLLRGTTGGLQRSEDGGRTWRPVNLLVTLEHVVGVAFAPDAPGQVWAAGRDGSVIRSDDGGWIWQSVRGEGWPPPAGGRIDELDVGAGGQVLLWTDRGLVVSADEGRTWRVAGESLANGRSPRDILRDLHTGRLLGRGHALANDLAAAAVIVLVVTGWTMWFRRPAGRRGAAGAGDAVEQRRHRRRTRSAAAVAATAALVGVLLLVLLAGAHARPRADLQSRSPAEPLVRARLMMGTLVRVSVWDGQADVRRAASAGAFAAIARVDSLMSTWRDDSDVLRVNRAAGQDTVTVAREVADVVLAALRVARLTDGAFDPTVLPLMRLWGFRGGEPRRPGAAELAATRARVGFEHVFVDSAGCRIFLRRPGMELDLGGIAKGYALDRALAAAMAAGAAGAVVDLGGNLGARGSGPPDLVAIRIPRAAAAPGSAAAPGVAGYLRPGGRCVATSGNAERHVIVGGERQGHILDPRTGIPSAAAGSVTVLSADGALGDALATALHVLGREHGPALVAQLPGLEALFLDETTAGDLIATVSPSLAWEPAARPRS
ncbi:MAG: FAD:protein FMN transferase [Candidatus Krumholzibacteriia bacterium]